MNLLLIGLPGSGKTTIGKQLSQELHIPFVDSDEEIVHREGKTILEIFELSGEEEFRSIETYVLRDILKRDKQIIALGGGIVLKEINRKLMKEKGKILFLDPAVTYELNQQETFGRPVMRKKSLSQLKEERQSLYLEVADAIIHEKNMDLVYAKAKEEAHRLCGF